jgi:ABC-type multidrug transport system fused ATPase/permease subunit
MFDETGAFVFAYFDRQESVESSALLPFYVRVLRRVLGKRARAAAFALATAMHAVGHAALAWAAAIVASALAGGGASLLVGSTPVEIGGSSARAAFSLTLLGLAAVVVKTAGGAYASYVQAELAAEAGSALRLAALDALLEGHPLRRPRHADQGDGASPAARAFALTAGVREVELGLSHGVLGAIRAIAQLAPIAALLVAIAPGLALAAACVFVPFAIAVGRARRAWKAANARRAAQAKELAEAADEAVRHADLWIAYGAQAKARSQVARLGAAIAKSAARVEASAAAISGANEVLGAIALLCAIFAARAGWLGDVGSGRLLAFAFAFFLAYRPIRDLADARLAYSRASRAYGELAATFEARAQEHTPVRARRTARPRLSRGVVNTRLWQLADLEMRALVLARGEARAPLTMRVRAGEIVAIVGPTGAGKTTLLRTLLGLDVPTSGDVLFDGAPLAAEPGPDARPFAWVPQEAPILADTLEENVALGARVDARAALATVGASHLDAAIGDVRVGAGGRALSGGERQWVALARAIATELPVLLLDEPTSGLDARSQARVLDAIAKLRGARTVILVTHRPEPLAIADRVVSFSQFAAPQGRPVGNSRGASVAPLEH